VTRIHSHTIRHAPRASRPLTIFTAYCLNAAQTPIDLPAGPAAAGEAE
jgi:hypothetical protein